MDKLECAGWIESSCDDGPGIRSVLFLQGCRKNCKGCHNKGIREHGKGTMVNIEELIGFINKNCCNRKLTISGGEPLEQIEALEILLRKLRGNNYDICLYTGWELKDVPDKILGLVNYVKTGGFVSELKDSNIQYVGSANQKMFRVKEKSIQQLKLAI